MFTFTNFLRGGEYVDVPVSVKGYRIDFTIISDRNIECIFEVFNGDEIIVNYRGGYSDFYYDNRLTIIELNNIHKCLMGVVKEFRDILRAALLDVAKEGLSKDLEVAIMDLSIKIIRILGLQ